MILVTFIGKKDSKVSMVLWHLFLEKIAYRIKQMRLLVYRLLLGGQVRETNLILLHLFTEQSLVPLPRRHYVFLLESFTQRVDPLVLDLWSSVWCYLVSLYLPHEQPLLLVGLERAKGYCRLWGELLVLGAWGPSKRLGLFEKFPVFAVGGQPL